MSTNAQLTTLMNAQLPTTGAGAIQAVNHRAVVAAIIASFANKTDDASLLGLHELDPQREYKQKEGFLFEGCIWQTATGFSPGENPKNPGNAIFIKLTEMPTIENFQNWDSSETYSIGATVKRNYKLFESLTNSNQGNDPELEPDPAVNWKEVSASENVWGETYQTNTIYSKRQVIFNTDLGQFYWLNVETDTFLSVDFTAELTAGKWVSVGSNAALTHNKMWIGDVTNQAEEIDVLNIFLNDAPLNQVLSLGYLNTEYDEAEPGQMVKGTFQLAHKDEMSWTIIPTKPVAATLDISNLTTVDLTTYINADEVTLNSANAVESINTILATNGDTIIFQPANGLSVTFVFNATKIQLNGVANVVIDGSKKESITFKMRDGIACELNRGVY